MGISAIDKVVNIEKASLAPSLSIKTGDKKTINLAAEGNINIINHAYLGTASPDNPDLIAQKGQSLQGRNINQNPSVTNIEIVLSPYIGIVKSPDLPGTRFHLEFTVSNNNPEPKVVKGAYVELNKGQVHFKKFFKINNQGSREPDLNTRFPIIIASYGATLLSIEFENLEKQLIELGKLEGELNVLVGNNGIVKQKFIFDVNESMINTLNLLQDASVKNNSPIVFDAMIKG